MLDPKTPGLLSDSFDPRDIWLDEILAGETISPEKFIIEELPYERQFGFPFCVSFATTTLIEYHYKKQGDVRAFSQPHLFFSAGGTTAGSTFRGNLYTAKERGVIPYTEMPMPKPDFIFLEDWFGNLKDQVARIGFKDSATITGFAHVQPNPEVLKAALLTSGPILVGVSTKGDYYKGNAKRASSIDNHAVLLVGWNEKSWIIFDSLGWAERTKGYVTLDLAYTFNTGYVVTELPKKWQKEVEAVRSEPFAHALNHYGKPRDYGAEVKFAGEMLTAFEKFNNKSVLDAAGRFWAVLINAGVYGGYNLSYYKWGMWQPGDIINDVYNWRRTGEHIFDFNKPRSSL